MSDAKNIMVEFTPIEVENAQDKLINRYLNQHSMVLVQK